LQRTTESIEARHNGPSAFSIEHRAYVMSGVHAAVNFIEAAINEMFEDIADGHSSYTAPLDEVTRSVLNAYWKKFEAVVPLSRSTRQRFDWRAKTS
jgi:hypothetical protein